MEEGDQGRIYLESRLPVAERGVDGQAQTGNSKSPLQGRHSQKPNALAVQNLR
jgi:hypothetical protein